MKGKEIIGYIHQDKMPDIEQVRENCVRQYVGRNPARLSRWATAAAVMAICLVLSGVAYAAINIFNEQRLDTGGSYEFITVSKDFYEREGTIFMKYLYICDVPPEQQPLFDAKTARLFNELLTDKVFTADGVYFELIAPVPGLFSRSYRADDKGHTLYDADGEEIGSILFETAMGSDPYRVVVMTEAERQRQFGFHSTYDEAVALLGRDFRFPTVFIQEFEPPTFQLNDIPKAFRLDSETEELLPYELRQVRVRFDGSPGIVFTVENIRDENNAAVPWHIPGGVIEELEVAETKIYKVSSSANDYNAADNYVWAHDSLVYVLTTFPDLPDAFTNEQCEEIIRSMIE